MLRAMLTFCVVFFGLCAALVWHGPILYESSSTVLPAALSSSANYAIEGATLTRQSVQTALTPSRPEVQHVPQPAPVRGVYFTSCAASVPERRESLRSLIASTTINSVVIDIKDFSGTISFPTNAAAWDAAWQASRCPVNDLASFIDTLHQEGVYVIGRIVVFQDPFYATRNPEQAVQTADGSLWSDFRGQSYVDVSAAPYWDHIVTLAQESYEIGFDELNFDYIRYPSDGDMAAARYPTSEQAARTLVGSTTSAPTLSESGFEKAVQLESFFAYLHESLTDADRFAAYAHENTGRAQSVPYLSADLFGMTTTSYGDLTIGQVQERAAPYFDTLAPMIYPSHYPDNYLGLGNPNQHPYEVIHHVLERGVARLQATTTEVASMALTPVSATSSRYRKPRRSASMLRPWLQDFDYGGEYDAAAVRAQIDAAADVGVNSWLLWSPQSRYTRAALTATTPSVAE